MKFTFFLYQKYQKTQGWPRRLLIKLFRFWVDIKSAIYKLLFIAHGTPLKIRDNNTDSAIFKSVFGANELKIMTSLKESFSPKFIVDAGAYAGYTSVWLTKKYPQAHIYAIEPEKHNFEVLTQNTRLFKNISVHKKALWPDKTDLFIKDSGTGDWGFKMEADKTDSIESVDSTTIDEIIKQSGFPKIDILKIDIEGAEKELFESNVDSWVDKVDIIIVELHDWFAPGCTDAYNKMKAKGDWSEFTKGVQKILIRKYLVA